MGSRERRAQLECVNILTSSEKVGSSEKAGRDKGVQLGGLVMTYSLPQAVFVGRPA